MERWKKPEVKNRKAGDLKLPNRERGEGAKVHKEDTGDSEETRRG
jgi:hypothetical protein